MHSVPTFEDLVAKIVTELRASGNYVDRLDARAETETATLRKAGRRAGHELGWKVRTLASRPHGSPEVVTIHVVVDEDVEELREIRARQLRAAVRAASTFPDN